MTPAEAEEQIQKLVRLVDDVRQEGKPNAAEAITAIEHEIVELKKVTGPRHITGTIER